MTTTTAPFFHVTRPRRSLVPDMRRPEPSPLPRPEWSLFSSHTLVLAALAADPEVRIREIAERVGLTERTVQGLLTDLVDAGFVTRQREGRRNRYRLHLDRPIPGPVQLGGTVGELVDLIVGGTTVRGRTGDDS